MEIKDLAHAKELYKKGHLVKDVTKVSSATGAGHYIFYAVDDSGLVLLKNRLPNIYVSDKSFEVYKFYIVREIENCSDIVIKNLAHAKELYEQGVLVPNKTILQDKEGKERVFYGFTLNSGNAVLGNPSGVDADAWGDSGFSSKQFTIIKPKKKIKLECWVVFNSKGDVQHVTQYKSNVPDLQFARDTYIEHICIDKEVEDE
jgi:hypothetical protein